MMLIPLHGNSPDISLIVMEMDADKYDVYFGQGLGRNADVHMQGVFTRFHKMLFKGKHDIFIP